MASSPAKLFSVFLAVSVVGWVVFTFAARLLAWFLSRVLSASVGFRVAGFNCLRDVTIKFHKGSIESVSIGEIKLSFRKSLVKLSVGVIYKDPKLHLLINDLEIVTRSSSQNKKISKPARHRSTGKGRWLVTSSMARILSISVTDLMIKVPKGAVDIKELTVDTFKIAGPNHILGVKWHLLPLHLHFGDFGLPADPMGSCNLHDALQSDQASVSNSENFLAPFVCEDLLITCDFGHEKEKGVKIVNLELKCGYVIANIDEKMFHKKLVNSENTSGSSNTGDTIMDTSAIKETSKSNSILPALKKQILTFPDKVSFSAPKLDLKFRYMPEGLNVDNHVTGIQFTCAKSLPQEDLEEATPHFDIHIDLNEIHLVREGSYSLLEVLKVAAVASLDIPMDSFLPIRAEIDAKLGGTQCNVMLSRLMPWMRLHSLRTKGMKLSKRGSRQEISQTKEIKPILWTCTVSAPEMTVMLYSLSGLVLYHACSQSSHLFANNIASKGIQIHTELGELLVHMEDEYREFLKENIYGVDTCSGSLMHIARVSLDWGYRDEAQDMIETRKLVFSIDISDTRVKFGFKHLESLVLNLMSFKTLFKSLQLSGERPKEKNLEHTGKKKRKGVEILKICLQKFSITYCGEANIVNMAIADPKRVNYGSQGGQAIVSVSADGTPRRATVTSILPGSKRNLKFSAALVISHLYICIDKEKKTTEAELERVKTIYEEFPENFSSSVKVTLLDMQNAKIVRRSGGLTEVAVCSLFRATDINLRWEPDAHLALYETFIRLKHFLHHSKLHNYEKLINIELCDTKTNEHGNVADSSVKPQKYNRRGSIFAIDVEMLRVSAELADGVEANMHVQSIFTENAKIGVLSEGFSLSLNGARVLSSTRIQISCIPLGTGSLCEVEPSSKRDWVVQGLDVHICMPYRLQLRAIEDAVEDMIRGLKLVSSAKASILFPDEKEKLRKVKSGTSKIFGSVKFVLHKLTAEIEDEPIQGWFDEHYHLMRNKVCELGVRLKFLEDAIPGSVDPGNRSTERRAIYDGIEIDIHDKAALQRLKEEIHKQTFRSYYAACQKMVPAEGSGACSKGFQAGFKPSSQRASLLSLSASELDITLTRIDGGEREMIEFIKGLDPICQEQNIPFSRLYGSDISVLAGSLVIQLRDYTSPLFSSVNGKCQGRVVLAQQATCFQPQIPQDVYIGRWKKVTMLRSASGTTPAMKMYSNLPLYFQRGEISFGVGYEPSFADISYAFQVALRRADLSTRGSGPTIQPPKKERSLPWWDDMRYYIHGKIVLYFNKTTWKFLATTNPYEYADKLQIVSEYMEIQQTDGHVDISAKEFKMYISSLESIMKNCSLKVPSGVPRPFIYAPSFSLNVIMDWQCESGNPSNHYLHTLPVEGEPRKKVYDPFRSTYLSLRWNFSLRPLQAQCDNDSSSSCYGNNSMLCGSISGSSSKMADAEFPTMNLGAHDLAWVFKWWSLNYNPPHKLRSFSRWRRFGIPRAARSGNLSLDKVLVEFFLRVDATPCCIRHVTLTEDDPANGLTFKMSNLKYELCYSRGKQYYTFDCKREPLDLVYRGFDLHKPEVYLIRDSNLSTVDNVSKANTTIQQSMGKNFHDKFNLGNLQEKHEDGFLLSSDYFTIRRQAPKADPDRLIEWQDTGRNLEITYVRSEFENGSESDHTLSEPSDDDDGFNVVLADNCQRVFVYGLKLLWTIENRDAVWSWVGAISKAFESPKPSPSRQYAQRKMIEERNAEGFRLVVQDASSSIHVSTPSAQHVESSGSSSPLRSKANHSSDVAVKHGIFDDFNDEGALQFMVNVIKPQFNLHSEEANGRFLLAAASGRVLARSFHSVVHVGKEMLEQALGASNVHIPKPQREMTWKKFDLSVILEDVQAHVAPTDVDPGAGLQWLPRILGSSEKLKRTGALLERVFMPCQMYFRYTRHKGGTADLKVKPLKELRFNSPNITATMTSRQFQVMWDVLSNLLFARLPKPRKNSLQYPSDDEDVEEEADEVVPDGVEEVELAKINLEQTERERKLLLDDIRSLTGNGDIQSEQCHSAEKGDCLWMINSRKTSLVEGLKRDLINLQKSRRSASSALRKALQKAAQLRLMEKEKNKTPSCAMRISMKISKVLWSMLADGNTFAEAEINDMVCDVDRDYKDIGIARFTTKYFVVRNCMPNAKCDTLLSAWNTPPEKGVMLRVDGKQGPPKDGNSPLELFQVEIYPLKIYLSEAMYRMMWDYFFPEEDDSQRRQEVWRVSTSAGPKRTRRLSSGMDAVTSSSCYVREHDLPGKSGTTVHASTNVSTWQGLLADSSQVSKLQSLKNNMVCGSHQELRRTSSFERTWEEGAPEGVTSNEAVSLVNSATVSSKGDGNTSMAEHSVVGTEMWKSKMKDAKPAKSGRLSHEEKKVGKSSDEKKMRPRKLMEFHNIKISQVELIVTYEGSRLAINDLRLLMDTFHRVQFTGTWRRLFSRVKKHIIWGVLKSVTGMQGKKFSDQRETHDGGVPENDLNLSDSDVGHHGRSDQFTASWLKRPGDSAGDGFVTSIRGLFNSQRRKAKAFMMRTMRVDGNNNEYHDEWSESDDDYPFARQLTITKAKKLLRRHTKKFRPRGQKNPGLALQDSLPSSPRETTPYQSDSSRSSYEDFHD